ncbi:hypothetical protein EG327_002446 [Venturia inaequalis]|uniref:Uncharacterized protein n=1 Tax=Venturia inaequalis TaxID=5025 RepID=A0A8H3VKE6_VENIN|nr:hypothetical protein EG327_002446 [Venturia inaequalis]
MARAHRSHIAEFPNSKGFLFTLITTFLVSQTPAITLTFLRFPQLFEASITIEPRSHKPQNSRRDESQVEKEARPKTQAKEKKDQSEI